LPSAFKVGLSRDVATAAQPGSPRNYLAVAGMPGNWERVEFPEIRTVNWPLNQLVSAYLLPRTRTIASMTAHSAMSNPSSLLHSWPSCF
jgi:hypothetical protein